MTFAHLVPHYIPKRPRIMLCDVDRTLLTHAHVLLPEVIAAAKAVPFPLHLATARSPAGVREIAAALGAESLTVCFNGAWIGDPVSGEAAYTAPIAPELASTAFETARKLGAAPAWFLADRVLCHPGDQSTVQRRTAVTGDRLQCTEQPTDAPLKLLLSCPGSQVESLQSRLQSLFFDLTVARSGPELIEVTSSDVSKGSALKWMATHFGLLPQDIGAAGDSDNDLHMLQAAGVAVAPMNAARAVKRSADRVFPSCDEGGMAHAFRWLSELPAAPSPTLHKRSDRYDT